VIIARFTRFAIVGLIATAIQYIILFILVNWVSINVVLASSTGFVISAFANYILNYRYTFRSKTRHGPAFIKFMTLASIGLILNSGIMQTLTTIQPNYLIAQLAATAGVLIWNFAGNSLWIFRDYEVNES
jgi:putative flippase GtrA